MKIDKRNPAHWIALALLGSWALLALALRPLLRRSARRGPPTVILYGHKLCGNLLAIHEHWRHHALEDFTMVFLTMDAAYHRELRAAGVASALATHPRTLALLIRADAVISDHGLHSVAPLVGRSSIRFFDVWHGIMFKGFAPQDFRLQHRYTEIWVASPLLEQLYVERFGFQPQRVQVTGYARTDCLVRGEPNQASAREQFDLPPQGKIILFGPTWQRDPVHGSIYPFGIPEQEFLRALSTMAERHGATVVVRAHLNSGQLGGTELPHIIHRPFARWPDAEHLLLACDVLVCDWSSIAFDWLLLDRPTVFLEVPIPTPRGFALGPEYRFGDVVNSLPDLLGSLEQAVADPQAHLARFAAHRSRILEGVYGEYADGHSSQRCLSRLRQCLA